jgi:hypothetical protein
MGQKFKSKDLEEYIKDIFNRYNDTHAFFIETAKDTGRTGPRVVVTVSNDDSIIEEEEFYYNTKGDSEDDVSLANKEYEFS